MSDFQKGALGVMFSVLVVVTWLGMAIASKFVTIDGQPVTVDPVVQGAAVAIVCLVVGISTPIGAAVVKGVKKVGTAVKGAISGATK